MYSIVVYGDHTVKKAAEELTDILTVLIGPLSAIDGGLILNAGDNQFLQILLSGRFWRRLALLGAIIAQPLYDSVVEKAVSDIYDGLFKDEPQPSPAELENYNHLLRLVDSFSNVAVIGLAVYPISPLNPGESLPRYSIGFEGELSLEKLFLLAKEADSFSEYARKAIGGDSGFRWDLSNIDATGSLQIGQKRSIFAAGTRSDDIRVLIDSKDGIKYLT